MTSKEAIAKLNVLSSYETSKEKHEEYKECINVILKDLEVLELLKKHLVINQLGEIVYEPKHHYQYINGDEVELFKPNEEDAKIKEWLENERK